MEIGPLQNNNTSKPENNSVERKLESSLEVKEKKDTVFISENSREKLAKLADAALKKFGVGEMPSTKTENYDSEIRIDKIKLAKERIATGYYSQNNIMELIADKLADVINRSIEKDMNRD